MTNRQVAKRLDLSEWTVINHVRQIMRKLELPSRVHVAQWISQQRSTAPAEYAEAGTVAEAG
jgi:DNA-binding CsgD family transcriptional regulator